MHLDYAIYELLKNAMRAVVEHHWAASSLPAVNVHVAGSPEQVTLRFSDQVIATNSYPAFPQDAHRRTIG